MINMAGVDMRSNEVIAQSAISFGTSGVRGEVSQFTPDVIGAFTLAFVAIQKHVKRVALAIDNRPSSPQIAKVCISTLKLHGYEVEYYGVIPTPALAYAAQLQGIPAIMITGSHIPFDRNGIKFYLATGEVSKADERAIINAQVSVPTIPSLDLPKASDYAKQQYIKRYVDYFPANLLAGKHIGIYQHTSAGRDIYPLILNALGAQVTLLGRSEQFVPIDTEAVAHADRLQARLWVTSHKLDALFSTDGDGDRALLADEQGEYLAGDILSLLAAKYLKIEALATPVSCNSSIEASGAFKQVQRTKIGSPYVIAGMAALQHGHHRVAGFEANGGFLLGSDVYNNKKVLKQLPTRDATLPALCALACVSQKKLSQVVADVTHRHTHSDRLKNFAQHRSAGVIELATTHPELLLKRLHIAYQGELKVDTTDGVRITLVDKGHIIHIRPSGNAPELRCYSEASNKAVAQKLVAGVLSGIETLF
ncbi:phosphomannomutase [Pseudoalteromonas sp. MMG022]|uniref:phosphomannomutase n=1 Tax=Pseudoalteromonas sp. MMG022 TaxID=2909978 RepID=UPI001F4902AE|nr:phosphomannomutase [Pseudoalteromonas sp. MMG022]MCF6435396.1 phosphomannomutase [Pseudoalteromonas sp. MMG022]